jgi:hypothetical protein
LTGEPGQEALLELPDHPLHLPLGLGPIRTARLGNDRERCAEIDPLGCEDGPAVTGRTDTEGGVPIGQNLSWHTAQVIQAGQDQPECGRPGPIERKADSGCSAAAEHRDQPKEVGRPTVHREGAEVRPVHLDLDARIGLKADRFDRFGCYVANALRESVPELLIVKEQEKFFLCGETGKVCSLICLSDIRHGLERERPIRLIVDGNHGANNRGGRVGIEFVAHLNRDAAANTLDLFLRQLDDMCHSVSSLVHQARHVLRGQKRRQVRCEWYGSTNPRQSCPYKCVLFLWPNGSIKVYL